MKKLKMICVCLSIILSMSLMSGCLLGLLYSLTPESEAETELTSPENITDAPEYTGQIPDGMKAEYVLVYEKKTLSNNDITEYTYEYDEQGRLSFKTESCLPELTKTEYFYDDNGNIMKEVSEFEEMPRFKQNDPEVIYEYNEKGLLVSRTSSGDTILYTYNENDDLIREEHWDYVIDYTYENGVLVSSFLEETVSGITTEITYDGNGNEIQLINKTKSQTYKTIFVYDDSNNITHKEKWEGNKLILKYDAVYTYDGAGNILKEEAFYEDETSSFEASTTYYYEGHGLLLYVEEKVNDEISTITEYRYDVILVPA